MNPLTFYGLKEQPFSLTPDPRFLHLAEPHRNALVAVLKGIASRGGFQLFTGPVGTGKTTLLNALLHVLVQRFSDNKIATALLVNPTLDADEFLESLLDEFEIPCPSERKPRRLATLQQFLIDQYQSRGTAVLLIDEAHLLRDEVFEEVRLLGNFETHSSKLLQIVLCGQPELNGILAKPSLAALRQRMVSRTHLRPLSVAETRAYIAERLHVAGAGAAPLFSAAALEEVFRLSQGVPRLINIVCDRALILGAETQRRPIADDIVRDAAADLELVAPCQVPQSSPELTQSAVGSVGSNLAFQRRNNLPGSQL